jgi:hypothetical protein
MRYFKKIIKWADINYNKERGEKEKRKISQRHIKASITTPLNYKKDLDEINSMTLKKGH